MASIQKYKDGYRAQISVSGIRESQTFRTKREATQWAEVRSAELRKEKRKVDGLQFTLADALIKYRDEVSPKKRGHRWESIRIDKILADGSLPSAVLLSELTPDMIGRWRDARLSLVSSGSVLREIGVLSTVLETARMEWRWLETNPVRMVRKPRQPQHRDVLMTGGQIRAILKACRYSPRGRVEFVSQSVAVCFLLALRTGMRAGELTGLTWDRVRDDFVILPVTKTVPRNVPITRKAGRLLAKMRGYRSGSVFGLSNASLSVNFRTYRMKAGVEGVTFHDARHYAATLLSRRLDVLDLCRMFGWSSTSQALTYYNPSASDIAKRLDG